MALRTGAEVEIPGSGRCRMFGPVHELAYPPGKEGVAQNLSIGFAVFSGALQLLDPFEFFTCQFHGKLGNL